MSAQIVFTLGASNIDRTKQFYRDVLGCPVDQDHSQFVSFKASDSPTAMALYTGDALAYDAGIAERANGFRGAMFSYIIESSNRVDEVMSLVDNAGGTTLEAAHQAQWGGYLGYFADPDGNLWKVVNLSRASADT